MRKSPPRTGQSTRTQRSAAPDSSRRFAPTTTLTLPAFGSGVPARFITSQNRQRVAALALGLLEYGILDWTGNDPLADIQNSLESWGTRECESIPWVGNFLDLTFSDSLPHLTSADDYEGNTVEDKGAFALTHCITERNDERGSPVTFEVAGAITALEERHPRLGASILALLEGALNRALSCFGPHYTFSSVQHFHWMGESNDQAVRDEMEANHENPEDSDIVTTAQFYAEMPTWLFDFQPLTKKEMLRIAALDFRAAQIIHATLAFKNPPYTREDDLFTHSTVPVVILPWREFGYVGQFYDTLVNDLLESGEGHNIACLTTFYPDDPRSIAAALRRLAKHFAALRALQPLLDLLTRSHKPLIKSLAQTKP